MAIGEKKPVLMKSDIGAEGGVAPAGYGLGEGTPKIAFNRDANAITQTGWYMCDVNTPDTSWWYGYHIQFSTGYAYQEFHKSTKGDCVCRTCINGTWSEWEWVNPPMIEGEEYRTTERYLGKPVYCRVVRYGDVSANTAFSIVYASNVTETGRFLRGSVSGRRNGTTFVTANQTGTHYSGCVFSCDGINYMNSNGAFSIRHSCKCTEALTDVVGVAYYTK